MTLVELYELGDIVRPLSASLGHLTAEQRMKLFIALLTQELCKLPPGERDEELACIIDNLPGCLRSTEEGMRIALAANARREA